MRVLQESGIAHIGKRPHSLQLQAPGPFVPAGWGFQGNRCSQLGRQEPGRGMAGISAQKLG